MPADDHQSYTQQQKEGTTMHQLLAHLGGRVGDLYAQNELNEVLLMIYSVIRRALLDRADSVEVTAAGDLVWRRGETEAGRLPLSGFQPTSSPQGMVDLILTRDAVVAGSITREGGADGSILLRLPTEADAQAA